jgi:hypothetical protein
MLDRGFSEVDLRTKVECATGLRRADDPERWVVETRHDDRPWEVVLEPDLTGRCLVAITACPV